MDKDILRHSVIERLQRTDRANALSDLSFMDLRGVDTLINLPKALYYAGLQGVYF